MGVAAGDYMYDVVVKKFTFAISSADEFLLLWPNGWMHQDATWYGGKRRLRRRCIRRGRSSPYTGHSPQFSVHV